MIKRVIVEYKKNYYQCMPVKDKWKCGKCLFGLINPFGRTWDMTDRCKRCRSKLHETVYGTNYFDLKVYNP